MFAQQADAAPAITHHLADQTAQARPRVVVDRHARREETLQPGPINTFPGWQALGRMVKRGERALILCMPITRKVRDDQDSGSEASESSILTPLRRARCAASVARPSERSIIALAPSPLSARPAARGGSGRA